MADPTYESAVSHAVRNGESIPSPETVDDLRILIDHYPTRAIPYLPGADWRARLGISQNSCREVEPFSIEWREQFVETLAADQDFALAIRRWIGGVE